MLHLKNDLNHKVKSVDTIIIGWKTGLTIKKKYDLQGVYKYLLLQAFWFLFNENT